VNALLLAPLGLAALAALALPLLIHLVRRLELRRTEFPALRWIAERARPRRRLRFERPWLLLVRLALLAALALLLARPVLVDAPQAATDAWLLLAPGADRAAARAAVPDLDAQGRWLAPGFPALDTPPPSGEVPLASLLRELDATLPKDAVPTFIVPSELAGLDGERAHLAHASTWRIVPGRMAAAAAAAATPIRFAVRYAPEAAASAVYLQAAVAAWNVREPGRYQLDAQPLTAPIPSDAHWLAWLGAPPSAQATTWIENGGTALLTNRSAAQGEPLWRDDDGRVLARSESIGRGRALALSGALSPADLPLLPDAAFPERLLAALQPLQPPTRAMAAAVAPRREAAAAAQNGLPAASQVRPLDTALASLIALLFVVERLVATRRVPEQDA
jgi:hypothetical protein